jgi:hypothetical protein
MCFECHNKAGVYLILKEQREVRGFFYFHLRYVTFLYNLFLYNSFIYVPIPKHFFLFRCLRVGYIREIPGSNLDIFIGYFDKTFLCSFLSPNKESARAGPVIGHDYFQFILHHSS